MSGQYTEETVFGSGRPPTQIPGNLADILDTTYKDDRDYLILGRKDDPAGQEIVRLGRIYAKRRGLSFRYLFTADGHLRFCMKPKRPYTKRDLQYWENR